MVPHATYQLTLSTGSLPFLADHRVGRSVVVPAAALVEMAFAAVRDALGSGFDTLRNVTFERLLGFDERGAVDVRVIVSNAAAGAEFVIEEVLGSGCTSAIARGRAVAADPAQAQPAAAISGVDGAAGTRVTPDELYALLERHGLSYGRLCRGVNDLRCTADVAVGSIRLPAELEEEHGRYHTHPVVLDSALHIAAVLAESTSDGKGVWVPAALKEITWQRSPGSTARSIVRRRTGTAGDQQFDVELRDDQDRPCARLTELVIHRVGAAREPLLPLARIVWEPVDVPRSVAPRRLCIVGDPGGMAGRMAAAAASTGVDAVVLAAGAAGGAIDSERLREAIAGTRTRLTPTVVYAPEPDERTSGATLFPAIAALQLVAREKGAKFALVTCGGAQIWPDETPGSLSHAALAALGPTASLEMPESWGGWVDLGARPTDAEIENAIATLCSDVLAAVACRGRSAFAPALVQEQIPAGSNRLPVRADATYLISGGLGGVGLEIAHWLASRQARWLALVARRPLAEHPPNVHEAVNALRRMGARVDVAALDVADEAAVSRWLAELERAGWPPLCGIVHAAGTLADALLGRMEPAYLSAVCSAKVAGFEALDRACAGRDLDFFIACSSAAAVLGSVGQSGYAMANGALHGLVRQRAARGLPALCVAWGPWRNIGMAARTRGRMDHAAGEIDVDVALAALERLVMTDAREALVLRLDVQQLQDVPVGAVRRQLLANGAVPPVAAGDTSSAATRSWLLRTAAEVLELGAQDLAPARSLLQLGMDSLTAVDLRNRLYRELGVELSVAEFLRGTSIDDLAQVIASRISLQPAGVVPLPAPDFEPQSMPLSKGQSALYVVHELSNDNSSYNVGEALRLIGHLDVEALRASIARLVQRHPMLRAVFFLEGDEVRQRVENRVPDVPVIDASKWSPDALHRRLLDNVTRRFDLHQAPPFRAALYRCGPAEHVLTFVIHHIAEDLWSLVILLRELIAFYEGATTRRPAELPPARAEYGHFIAWQARMLSGAQGKRHGAYWRRQLASPLPFLNLPWARTRPPEKTYAGRTFAFTLDRDIPPRLHALADASDATLYSVALAAFTVLLHRYTGQTDVIVGSPFAGRPHPDLDQVVGFFDNPLPLRVDLSGNPTFLEVLRRVHQVVLEAQEHQDLPFPVIVEEARPARDPSRSPLFDCVFVLRKAQAAHLQELTAFTLGDTTEALHMGSVRIENAGVLLIHSQAQFDLTLALAEIRGTLKGSIEYNTDLFDEAPMRRLVGHYENLLRSIAEDADAPVDGLSILMAEERTEAIDRWNDTAWNDAPRVALHELFERRVDDDAARLAVVSSARSLSYGDVERHANAIAGRLLDACARPGGIVAVMLPKGWQEVVAVVGVLKTGAAYLPIDPAWPPARRLDLLVRSGARVVVAQMEESDLDLPPDVRAIGIGSNESELGAIRPARSVDPQQAAYVIFTSGSTGSPKGVVTDHMGPVNTIADVNNRFGVGPCDRVLAISRLTFDLSVYDIFGMLSAGGALVIPADDERHDPAAWADLVLRHEVTIWNSVPAVFQLYLQHLAEHPANRPRSLRLALLSGDWIPVSLPEQAWRLLPDIRLVSLGGATEASIWSILHPIDAVDPGWTSIPYGRPMRNQRIYVLDRNHEPCPRGVAGEIHIGGCGVARGYLGAPEQTDRAFFDCPPMGRIYRTGDLGRYRDDGVVEFLGRKDRQVKVRGHRVELEEVEAVLLRQLGVAEAAVVPFERAPGQQALAAYFVPASQRPDVDVLRAGLAAALPDYMMPTSIVCLDKLPLTSNGKVDRAALPCPDAAPDSSGPLEEIADPAGALMARLWARHLRRIHVALDDDFYALGGDSVTAIQIAADARREGLRVSPGDMLRARTIGALLAVVSDSANGDSTRGDSADYRKPHAGAEPGFPLSGLSRQELERVLARFEQE